MVHQFAPPHLPVLKVTLRDRRRSRGVWMLFRPRGGNPNVEVSVSDTVVLKSRIRPDSGYGQTGRYRF